MKHWEEAGFHQDPNFYYFTGLRNAQAAILAIAGASKESWLFVRPKMGGDKDLPGLDSVFPLAGSESEAAFAIEDVVPWNNFAAWLDARQSTMTREIPKAWRQCSIRTCCREIPCIPLAHAYDEKCVPDAGRNQAGEIRRRDRRCRPAGKDNRRQEAAVDM
jgi:hypothetical protein